MEAPDWLIMKVRVHFGLGGVATTTESWWAACSRFDFASRCRHRVYTVCSGTAPVTHWINPPLGPSGTTE